MMQDSKIYLIVLLPVFISLGYCSICIFRRTDWFINIENWKLWKQYRKSLKKLGWKRFKATDADKFHCYWVNENGDRIIEWKFDDEVTFICEDHSGYHYALIRDCKITTGKLRSCQNK